MNNLQLIKVGQYLIAVYLRKEPREQQSIPISIRQKGHSRMNN